MPYDKFVGEYPKRKPVKETKHLNIGNVAVFKSKKGKPIVFK